MCRPFLPSLNQPPLPVRGILGVLLALASCQTPERVSVRQLELRAVEQVAQRCGQLPRQVQWVQNSIQELEKAPFRQQEYMMVVTFRGKPVIGYGAHPQKPVRFCDCQGRPVDLQPGVVARGEKTVIYIPPAYRYLNDFNARL